MPASRQTSHTDTQAAERQRTTTRTGQDTHRQHILSRHGTPHRHAHRTSTAINLRPDIETELHSPSLRLSLNISISQPTRLRHDNLHLCTIGHKTIPNQSNPYVRNMVNPHDLRQRETQRPAMHVLHWALMPQVPRLWPTSTCLPTWWTLSWCLAELSEDPP